MKKIFALLPLLVIPFLNGCESKSEVTQLTYGTYMHDEPLYISSMEFTNKFENNENFLLAIYPKDSSCYCWSNFERVLKEASSKEHLLVYKFYAEDVESNPVMKEIGGFKNRPDAPTFYIIKNKKIARFYNYSHGNPFFSKYEDFINELALYTKKPKMFYIESTILDSLIEEGNNFTVLYARSECNDCQYVIPNTLTPYFDSLELVEEPLYVFDLQVYYNTDIYQDLKDHFLLSEVNNPNLGFNRGVVPTFQRYENGELKDMCVYLNEGPVTYSEAEDCYYALGAYYNETRLQYFHYLDNVAIKDLTKVKIDKNKVTKYGEAYYWDNADSSIYYDTILKAFLDTYYK